MSSKEENTNGNSQINQVLIEIRALRDDVREDVNTIHDKMENQRACIVEKIENTRHDRQECFEHCSEAMAKKVDNKWFRWAIGIIVICILGISGISSKNMLEIGKVDTKIEQNQKTLENIEDTLEKHNFDDVERSKRNSEQIEELKKHIDRSRDNGYSK